MSARYSRSELEGRSLTTNHLHLDGAIPPEELFNFYSERGIQLYLPEHDLKGKHILLKEISTI